MEPIEQPALDPSTGFTCVTCQLVFRNAEVQREHYRTDWHRYNLKRQVAELPPITDEQFRSKVLMFREEKEQALRNAEEETSLLCEVCNKRFNSQNAYSDHLKSKKHLEIVKNGRRGPKQPRKKTATTSTSTSTTVTTIEKIEKKEPEDEKMESDGEESDSSGWHTDNGSDEEDETIDNWDYDEDKALPITSCLFCPQTAGTFDKNLEHMKTRHDFTVPDKQYCADLEGLIQYLGLKVGAGRVCLYCPESKGRYARTLQDPREPKSMLEFADWYDYSPLYDELANKEAPIDDGWTLTLPSGAKIGHRALMRYYKQNIRGGLNQPKALSWIGGTGSSGNKMVVSKGVLIQAARDIRMMERARRRFDLRAAVWSNKLFKTRGRVGDN
ncbi:unnamed protein product, partial [Mesorhabditis belari]|uniref:C2H2-type domain-containing protein n=1 Tax=Mesorhabditis belari TaxID=2138241 RepID=A0AAF3FDK7_9BILA